MTTTTRITKKTKIVNDVKSTLTVVAVSSDPTIEICVDVPGYGYGLSEGPARNAMISITKDQALELIDALQGWLKQ